MRPGHGAEGKNEPGRIADRLGVAVGPADQKSEIVVAMIATLPEKIGKAGTGQGLAALIEGDDEGLGWDRASEAFRLFLEPRGHIVAPRLGDFSNLDGGDAASTARRL